MPVDFTGYDPRLEEREALTGQCIQFDVRDLVVQGDLPDTRGIMKLMRRDDQFNMNSCAGFGATNAGEVGHFLRTKKWRQFAPKFTYKEGQKKSGIRGDRGATIHGVVRSMKEEGLLPEDVDGDGVVEYPYDTNYNQTFPRSAYDVASKWKVGYSVELNGGDAFDLQLRFLQSNQGAIVVGGPWGNWRPDSQGVCRRFSGGGGGHARARIDWIKLPNGETAIVEANSHGSRYGKNGFSFMTREFVNSEARDRWFVAIGVSDLSSPEPRKIDLSEKWLV